MLILVIFYVIDALMYNIYVRHEMYGFWNQNIRKNNRMCLKVIVQQFQGLENLWYCAWKESIFRALETGVSFDLAIYFYLIKRSFFTWPN